MRSYRFAEIGNLHSLELCEEPMQRPQRGEVLVRVRASALNFRDIAMVRGTYSHRQTNLVPLSDAAGEVVETGEDSRIFKPGDRVISTFHPQWYGGDPPAWLGTSNYGSHREGWLTEYKVVHEDAVIRAPEGLSFEEAATLPCAGLTAWSALHGIRPLRLGSHVLTLGSGGVSVFAVQLAKHVLGAQVIATTSSSDKAARLIALGADEIVNYRDVPQWGPAVRSSTGGRGVDRVVEVGGAGTLRQSLLAVASSGEIGLVGFLDKNGPPVDYELLFQSRATLHRISVGHRSALKELVRAVESKSIKPVIDKVFPFEEALEAWKYYDQGNVFGKVVITH